MNPRPQFNPIQAVKVARAFEREGVDYLFIGKSAAMLLGYPSMTQDVDVFADRTPENARRIIRALKKIGFRLPAEVQSAIMEGKDFVQIKFGPFDVDIIFAPDGIRSFADAKARGVYVDGFHVASLRDIIASKRASGRTKDLNDLPQLEDFRKEYEKTHAPALRSAADVAVEKSTRCKGLNKKKDRA